MNPTDEQLKILWEWCGLEYNDPCWIISGDYIAFYGDCYSELLQSLTLDNLFKYAVPMFDWVLLQQYPTELSYVTVKDGSDYHFGKDKDPALALFKAIYEVIEG